MQYFNFIVVAKISVEKISIVTKHSFRMCKESFH